MINTEIGKKYFSGWKRGIFSRNDVLWAYIDQISEYMNTHSEEPLAIAKDLLYLLNEVIPE